MTRLYVHEVVTRDGFQIEPRFIPTEAKIAVVDALSETGLHKIEVTSFVSPKAVPALADAEAVMAGIKRNPKVKYVALVANPRGAERALAAKVDEIVMVISVSESHNRANVRRSTEESFAGFAEIMHAIRGTGVGHRVRHGDDVRLSVRGLPEAGAHLRLRAAARRPRHRRDRARRHRRHGQSEADAGHLARGGEARCPESSSRCTSTTPAGWGSRTSSRASTPGSRTTSRRSAASAAARSRPARPATSAPKTSCTCCESMGHDTGVDLDRLIRAARGLPALVGHDVPGQVMKAGKSTDLHPLPADPR